MGVGMSGSTIPATAHSGWERFCSAAALYLRGSANSFCKSVPSSYKSYGSQSRRPYLRCQSIRFKRGHLPAVGAQRGRFKATPEPQTSRGYLPAARRRSSTQESNSVGHLTQCCHGSHWVVFAEHFFLLGVFSNLLTRNVCYLVYEANPQPK